MCRCASNNIKKTKEKTKIAQKCVFFIEPYKKVEPKIEKLSTIINIIKLIMSDIEKTLKFINSPQTKEQINKIKKKVKKQRRLYKKRMERMEEKNKKIKKKIHFDFVREKIMRDGINTVEDFKYIMNKYLISDTKIINFRRMKEKYQMNRKKYIVKPSHPSV